MVQNLKPNNQEELPSCIILSMFNKAAVEKCRAWRRGRFRMGVTKKGSAADTAASCPLLASTLPGFNSQTHKQRARL